MFDLILRGGTVIDPGQGLEGSFDVAVEGDRVAAVASDATASDAARVVDVRGRLVVPGLVDMHTHIFSDVTRLSVDVDSACLARGVTTSVDGGSTGSASFEAFRRWIAEPAKSRVYCFLHLSWMGLISMPMIGELALPAFADPEGAIDILRRYPDLAIGLKIRVEEVQVGGSCLPMLKIAREVGDATGVPIMVHLGNSLEALPEILKWLKAGDIVTHCMTGRRCGLLDAAGRVFPEALEARQRGVWFDVAHGGANFSHRAAEKLLEQGFVPDAISTDLTVRTVNGPVYDLPTIMSKFVRLGLPLAEVVRLTTWQPARILRREHLFGTLRPGSTADITVLEWEEGELPLKDSLGDVMTLDRRLVPYLTVRAGKIVQEKGKAQCH